MFAARRLLVLACLALAATGWACEPVHSFSVLDAGSPADVDPSPGGASAPADDGLPDAGGRSRLAVQDAGDRDAMAPDAGDAGPVECGGMRCEAPTLAEGFDVRACCHGEACGLRIVGGPIEVTDDCIIWSPHGEPNRDCASTTPDGLVYAHECCLESGHCGTRIQLDTGAFCVDPASLGLPSGSDCDPDSGCAELLSPCESDGDCCDQTPAGALCVDEGEGPRCARRCESQQDCLGGCCRLDPDAGVAGICSSQPCGA